MRWVWQKQLPNIAPPSVRHLHLLPPVCQTPESASVNDGKPAHRGRWGGKLNPVVREAFLTRFNKNTFLEGYGATETTPVASVNLPGLSGYPILGSRKSAVNMAVSVCRCRVPVYVSSIHQTFELPTGSDGMILINLAHG